MYAFVSHEIALHTEYLITNITRIRAFFTMHAFVCHQPTAIIERFTTHVTDIWMLSTMHMLMFLQTSLKTE